MTADPVAELALSLFGVSYLYPIQRFVIANTLEGRSQIVVLPTGAGKSLCFQLPSRLLEGLTLVVVPLLSLLEDQLEHCRLAGLAAAAIRGGQSAEERERIFAQVHSGALRLLYATPEAMRQPKVREAMARFALAHAVVDEAHCIAEWGPSFRPAYLELGRVFFSLRVPRLSAFTATASTATLKAIREVLFPEREPTLVEGDPDRPNLRYRFVPVLSKARALEALVRNAERPAIVFCRSRPAAETAARLLRRRLGGGEVFFYHAGLTAEERRRVEAWFLPSAAGVLTATSAYGLGVDKPDVHTVIHLDAPYSVEAFLQESGRAGRDGRPAECTLLYSADDMSFAEQAGSELERRRYRILLECVLEGRCRRASLLSALGLQPPACSGCDVCEGTARAMPESLPVILGFFRSHRRRFGRRQAVQILHGRRTYDVVREDLDGVRGWSLLADWEREDIEEALETLERSGHLRVPERGLWKGLVTLGKDPWVWPETGSYAKDRTLRKPDFP